MTEREGAAGPVSETDVAEAAARLRGIVRRTPLLESPILNEAIGGRLLIKAESLQHTGAFKYRGASNAAGKLQEQKPGTGIVAASSGNHACAISAVAKRFGIEATVVIPFDAPPKKIAVSRFYGARIVHYDKKNDDRDAIAAREAETRGAAIIESSNNVDVVAGQATAALELLEQVAETGAKIDTVLVPCGGGGLTAGCALVLAQHAPDTEVIPVEPEGFDDMGLSLAAGHRVQIDFGTPSICDGMLHRTPSAIPFEVLQGRVKRGLTVTDDDVRAAMSAAFEQLNLVLETNGATALAAALSPEKPWQGQTVAVMATGGNVNREIFKSVLETIAP